MLAPPTFSVVIPRQKLFLTYLGRRIRTVGRGQLLHPVPDILA